MVEGTKAYKRVVALMGETLKNSDYRVTADSAIYEQGLKSYSYQRDPLTGKQVYLPDKRPATALKVRIEKISDVPAQPTNINERTCHADQT